MNDSGSLVAGDKVLVGTALVTVSAEFAASLGPGDQVLGIASTASLKRIPAAVRAESDRAMGSAVSAFDRMRTVDQAAVTRFFGTAARLLSDDGVFARVADANRLDVESATARNRSTTRLVMGESMRKGMVEALCMWRDSDGSSSRGEQVVHEGWTVTEHRAPLGVVGFVFEGRPNVFADATGVLRGGNTVVFRIGSDALGTARALMTNVVEPALRDAGLPPGAVNLLDSPEHAAGWAMFSDPRLSLAVARGSGEAVAELGSIARQAGVPVSLHGTGGAWMIVGNGADSARLASVVTHSLDRKVCNTLNVACVVRDRAEELVPVVLAAADAAASTRGLRARVHAVGDALAFCGQPETVSVVRADGEHREPNITGADHGILSREFEWESTPEFALVLVDSVEEACDLFNAHSPQFVVSCVSTDAGEQETVWAGCNAPFVGDGFTRWVDGQFALLRPELGLSNWQSGRLFARSGILSGDSAFTVRLRVTQADDNLHR